MPEKNQPDIDFTQQPSAKNLIESMQGYTKNFIQQENNNNAFNTIHEDEISDKLNQKIQEIATLMQEEDYYNKVQKLIAKTIGETFVVESIKLIMTLPNEKLNSSYELKLNENKEIMTKKITDIIHSTQKFNKNILLFFNKKLESKKNENVINSLGRYIYIQNKNTPNKTQIAQEAALIMLNLLRCREIKKTYKKTPDLSVNFYLEKEERKKLSDNTIKQIDEVVQNNNNNNKTEIDIESEIKNQSKLEITKQIKKTENILNELANRKKNVTKAVIPSTALAATLIGVLTVLSLTGAGLIAIATLTVVAIFSITLSLAGAYKIHHIKKEEKNLSDINEKIKIDLYLAENEHQSKTMTKQGIEQSSQKKTMKENKDISIINIEQIAPLIEKIKK